MLVSKSSILKKIGTCMKNVLINKIRFLFNANIGLKKIKYVYTLVGGDAQKTNKCIDILTLKH